MKFDELNKLEDYFEPMAISIEDKNRRRELCDLLTDAFLYFFSVYEVHRMHNSMLEKALYEQLLVDRISDAVSKVTGIDGPMSSYIRKLSREVVDTTYRHTIDNNAQSQIGQDKPLTHDDSLTALNDSEEPLDVPNYISGSHFGEDEELISEEDDEVEELMEREAVAEYWLSMARAINIAQNETNTFLNYTDFTEAKEIGRTYKRWLTMLDPKVRDSHEEAEGQTIGIDEYFQIGNSQLLFPHDWSASPDPKETINCRCAVEYL